MPFLSHLIPVCLPPTTATPYFRQLASAVGYLHERGITHNDIKPANVLMSHNDVPVLVDFGFAQRWDTSYRGSFLSSISWGTPEVGHFHRKIIVFADEGVVSRPPTG
jgi:serine/threonine protein kinase